MRMPIGLLAALAILACSPQLDSSRPEPTRILFVGNSLTYVGNLPAVLDALAAEKYSYVVLQERGGDFACGFGPEVCANSRSSLAKLSDLVRQHGATPVLLGTYQGHPEASRGIVEAESRAAAEAGIGYVSVSDHLMALRAAYPEMTWFASDGMHPGSDLTLLCALLLFRHMHGVNPARSDISVDAPIYSYTSPLTAEVRRASASTDLKDVPLRARYEADRVTTLLGSMR